MTSGCELIAPVDRQQLGTGGDAVGGAGAAGGEPAGGSDVGPTTGGGGVGGQPGGSGPGGAGPGGSGPGGSGPGGSGPGGSGGDPTSGSGGDPTSGSGGDPTSGSGGDPTSGSGGDPTSGSGGHSTSGSGGDPTSGSGGHSTSGSGGDPHGSGGSGSGTTHSGGGLGGAGGSGGSGGGIPEGETCDFTFRPIVVALDVHEFATGEISASSTNDVESTCTDYDPNVDDHWSDVVYEVSIQQACTVDFTVESTEMNLELSFREDCLVDQFYCMNLVQGIGTEHMKFHVEAGTYYVVVQGDVPGAYSLHIACDTPVCGDNVLNPGEECEDGNASAGDGCDPSCAIEAADPAVEDCAAASGGSPHNIVAGSQFLPASGLGTTLGALDNEHGSCQWTPSPPDESYSADHVYKIRAQVDGEAVVTLGLGLDGLPMCGPAEPDAPYPNGCYDRVLYVRESDCAGGVELACSDSVDWFDSEVATFNMVAGVDYYVFVDGWLSGYGFDVGQYALKVDFTED